MTRQRRKSRSGKRAQAKGERKNKTLWHRLLGKWLELLLTRVDIIVYTEPQIMSEPPKVDILLLRRNSKMWTPAQLRLLPDGVRDSAASHILIEFKFTESLNRARFQQALGYDYFYRQAQQVDEATVQTFVFASIAPRAAFLQEYGYQVTEQPGVYRSTNPMLAPVVLLVLNELRPELHNTFVQCFASRGQVRRAAFERLMAMEWRELDEAFWDFFTGLQNQYVETGKEESIMRKREAITPETVMEQGRLLRKSLLAVLSPEERLAGLAPEQRLAGLAPEERLAGLTEEEMVALMKQIEAQLQKQPNKPEGAKRKPSRRQPK